MGIHQEVIMEHHKAKLAEKYYTLISKKDAESIKQYLHPDVEFHGPLATLKGQDAVVQATSNFMKTFKSLTIRTKFDTEDQAMVVYDVDIPGIKSDFPGASLLSFQDDLISKIELFYDASCFLTKKEEIFS